MIEEKRNFCADYNRLQNYRLTMRAKRRKQDEMELKEKILKLVNERDHVSFVEIERFIPETVDPDAKELGAYHIGQDNLFFWAGLTKEATNLIRDMIQNDEIKFHGAGKFVYLIDGGGLNYPIAKRVQKYKKPHWFPVTLRPGKKAS